MKKLNRTLCSLLFAAVMLLPFTASAYTFPDGNGSQGNPYQISTPSDLAGLATDVNAGTTYSGVYFKLTNDIDLTAYLSASGDGYNSGKGWIPIGSYPNAFQGVFDGDGHKVTGLFIDDNTLTYAGLFGFVGSNGSTVKNLGVEGNVSGYRDVGGIAGYVAYYGSITNCYFMGNVSGANIWVGGVAGHLSDFGAVINCYATGSVSGSQYVGGVVGYTTSIDIVKNCAALNSSVTATSNSASRVVGTTSGSTSVLNNIAFDGMTVTGYTGSGDNGTGATKPQINTATFLQNLFSANDTESVWAYANKRLPSFFGKTEDMPAYLETQFLAGGDGTQLNPFIIATVADLANLATLTNAGNTAYNTQYYKLANDIDLAAYLDTSGAGYNDGKGWIPIGGYSNCFKGAFDGNGHKITGLSINDNDITYTGLFGDIDGGTINNLGVEGNISANVYVGGLAGWVSNSGSITNCYFNGTVSSTNGHAGGVAGVLWSSSSIINCYATGSVSAGTSDIVGGVVGYAVTGNVKNCAALNQSVTGRNYVGRVVGSKNGGTIQGNIAFAGMTGTFGTNGDNGTDASILQINTASFLQSLFTNSNNPDNVWTFADDYLPGLGGNTVEMPAYLKPFSGGNGTTANPYLITTAAELNMVRYYLNKAFILNNDIDLQTFIQNTYPTDGWLPIGNITAPFKGTFNGNGHKITGLWINRYTDYVGLFGYINGGALSNLGVETAAAGVSGYQYVGCLAGYNFSSVITNCYAAGTVSGSNVSGGLVGINYSNSTISNSYASVNISGGSIGGLAGNNSASTITNCYTTGNVSGYSLVGGLVGQNSGTITNCYATGAVTGNYYFGGLVGHNIFNSTISNSFFNSETTKQVYGIGYDENSGNNSTNIGATPKTTAEMKTAATFAAAAWNFTPNSGIWSICEGISYPWLQWQNISCESITFCGGSGTTADPYQICTAEQLNQVRNYLGKSYILNNDIDLAAFGNWTPIGNNNSTSFFSGTFDGNGHIITGLSINDNTLQAAGLFGFLNGATIKNLGVEGTVSAKGSVGGIAGNFLLNGGTIKNCYFMGNVSGTNNYAGGVAGNTNNGNITNCYFMGNVSSTGDYAGGVIGNGSGNLTNCYAIGTVNGNSYVGGVAGYFSGNVKNCAALNRSITGNSAVFRVGGTGTLQNNFAFEGMTGNFTIAAPSGSSNNGDNASILQINTATFLQNLFAANNPENVWTYANKYLPGLFGNTVDMPAYLQVTQEPTPNAVIDFINETLTGLSGSYTINANPVTITGNYPIDASWLGTTIAIIKTGNGTTTIDSDPQNLTILARPAAPAPGKTDCTTSQNNDGTITGVTSAMEYSADGVTWINCLDGEVTGLTDGTYYVRLKATTTAFHSESAVIAIAASDDFTGIAAPTAKLKVYPNPTSRELRIESGELRIKSVEISDMSGRIAITNCQLRITDGVSSINVAELPAGVYFLRITLNEGETAVYKFIKN